MEIMRDVLVYAAIHYWFFALIALLVGFCFASIFVTACLEKHVIRQFQPGAPEEVCPPSGYFRAMNESAAQAQLIHCGNYVQSRSSSLYRCCLSLWLSPDHQTLVVVGGGKLAKIDHKRTFFVSVTQDGTEMITVDDFGIVDPSDLRNIDVVYNADFAELSSRHAQRLAMMPGPWRPFSPTRCLEQYEDLLKVRAEHMVTLGLAKFIDRTESTWRYTMKGAWISAYHGYFKGLEKAKAQSHRQGKKRPGC